MFSMFGTESGTKTWFVCQNYLRGISGTLDIYSTLWHHKGMIYSIEFLHFSLKKKSNFGLCQLLGSSFQGHHCWRAMVKRILPSTEPLNLDLGKHTPHPWWTHCLNPTACKVSPINSPYKINFLKPSGSVMTLWRDITLTYFTAAQGEPLKIPVWLLCKQSPLLWVPKGQAGLGSTRVHLTERKGL